jgi:hypothetical protein
MKTVRFNSVTAARCPNRHVVVRTAASCARETPSSAGGVPTGDHQPGKQPHEQIVACSSDVCNPWARHFLLELGEFGPAKAGLAEILGAARFRSRIFE